MKSKFGENPADGLHALANFEKGQYQPSTEGVELVDANLLKPPDANTATPPEEIEIPLPEIEPPRFPDRTDEFGSLDDSIPLDVETSGPKGTPRISDILGSLTNMAAGLGAGIAISKGLEAAGSDNVVLNTALSGAGGGTVGAGAQMATKQLAKYAGMSVAETMGETVAKGLLQGAAEGGVGALVALPVQVGVQEGLEKAGLDKYTAMPIAGLVGGGVGAGAVAAGAAAMTVGVANAWNPIGWSILTGALIGEVVSGGFAIAEKLDANKKARVEELQERFWKNQTDINKYNHTGGLTGEELQEINKVDPEFFDRALTAYAKARKDHIATGNKLRDIETKYQNRLRVGGSNGVVIPEGSKVTKIYGSKLIDLTQEDRTFLEANDPNFFSRYGQYQDLMVEEYKYATGKQLSDYNTEIIRKRDPNFFNRIYPTMHPEDAYKQIYNVNKPGYHIPNNEDRLEAGEEVRDEETGKVMLLPK